MADKTEGSIVIDAPIEKVMEIIADFETYPDWIGRFHELDPVRVHFAHDRAIWERDVAESIR